MTTEKTQDLSASSVEACRICLATDVRLHSLQETHIGTCIQSIGVFTKSFDGLPNYVCYECAPVLIKCNKLVEKSKTAQSTLLEIFVKNGKISKPLIEEQKKSDPKLQSSLDSYLLMNYFYVKYDNDSNTSDFIKIESNENNSIKLKNEVKEELGDEVSDSEMLKMIKVLSQEDKTMNDLSKDEETNSDSDVETIEVDVPVVEIMSDDEKMGEDFISLKPYAVTMDKPVKGLLAHNEVPLYNKNKKMRPIGVGKRVKKKQKKSRRNDPPPPPSNHDEDKFVRRYFNINIINKPGRTTSKKYFCKSCPQTYDYANEARDHTIVGCQIASSINDGMASNAMSGQQTLWEVWPGGSQ